MDGYSLNLEKTHLENRTFNLVIWKLTFYLSVENRHLFSHLENWRLFLSFRKLTFGHLESWHLCSHLGIWHLFGLRHQHWELVIWHTGCQKLQESFCSDLMVSTHSWISFYVRRLEIWRPIYICICHLYYFIFLQLLNKLRFNALPVKSGFV